MDIQSTLERVNKKMSNIMSSDELLRNLCYYDKRNPDSEIMDENRKKNLQCYCDNCFNGRSILAETSLYYLNKELNNEKRGNYEIS